MRFATFKNSSETPFGRQQRAQFFYYFCKTPTLDEVIRFFLYGPSPLKPSRPMYRIVCYISFRARFTFSHETGSAGTECVAAWCDVVRGFW